LREVILLEHFGYPSCQLHDPGEHLEDAWPGPSLKKVVEASLKTPRQYKLLVPELVFHLRGRTAMSRIPIV
jgi:hypothetical protein